MTPARRELIGFWTRFALLFGISWIPIPFLPDAYSTAFAAAANVPLAAKNLVSDTQLHMRGPERLRMVGGWKPDLVIEAPGAQAELLPVNVKIFSYRPLAVFLALALAATLVGRRRKAIVIGGGFGIMLALTTLLTALPALTEVAVRGGLGAPLGLLVETSFVVLLTPLMVYLLPALVWWLLMWRTRPRDAAGW